MTKWSRDGRAFTVRLGRHPNRDGSVSRTCTVPRPLVDRLGPCEALRFEIAEDGTVTVQGA